MNPSPESWCPQDPPGPPPTPRRTPQERGISVSSLCSMGWQPIMLTGLLRDLLTRHFTGPGNVEIPDFRPIVWRPDDTTGILIESIWRWRGALVEKRPAVIIKRNAMQNMRLGVGDKLGFDRQGQRTFATFWLGSHTLFCLQGSGGAAEILATEVQREVTQFGPAVVDYLGLFKWSVTEVGATSEIEEARESFVVPVTVGWCYEETWKLEYESMRLRKVPMSVLLYEMVVAETR